MAGGGQQTFRHYGYKPPGTDSPRARANAVLFLVNCVKVDHLTPEFLAKSYHLKPATAERLLGEERARRG